MINWQKIKYNRDSTPAKFKRIGDGPGRGQIAGLDGGMKVDDLRGWKRRKNMDMPSPLFYFPCGMAISRVFCNGPYVPTIQNTWVQRYHVRSLPSINNDFLSSVRSQPNPDRATHTHRAAETDELSLTGRRHRFGQPRLSAAWWARRRRGSH